MQITRRNLMLGTLGSLPQESPFSVEVKVVTLLATVHDASGAPVTNLNKEDFRLEEDGIPQTIRYFSRESNLPLTIGLLVDTSQSETDMLERERRASYSFLDHVLREDDDLAFIAHFDVRVEILQELTSSREKLALALGKLRTPRRPATLLYQAVRECSENQMRKQQGRKALIIISDGVDVRSKTSIVTAIEYAQRANAIIYSIVMRKWPILAYFPPAAATRAIFNARGTSAMQRLARETGGTYFEVSKDNPIDAIFSLIEEQLRTQYSIGYTPERNNAMGQYRQIRLTTNQPGLFVQTRAGYYAE